jgi:hypothetical protein
MNEQKVYLAILIVLTAACGLCAVVSAPGALMVSVMAFDAPGSEHYVWAWAMSLAILSIPLWFVAAAVLGWILRLRGWQRSSLMVAAVPPVAALVGWALLFD